MREHVAIWLGALWMVGCGARSDLASGTGTTASGGASTGDTGASSTSGAGTTTTSSSGGSPCDEDTDGHEVASCGGDDCDDGDASVHPGAADKNIGTGPWLAERILENIPGDVRGQPAIFIEQGGAIHVTHGEAGLRHVTNRTGVWVEQMIDPEAVGPSSLKVDVGGAIHVSYVTAAGLRYATDAGGGWELETVDEEATGASSLALDGVGMPHLLYASAGGMHLRRRVAGGWSGWLVVDGGVGAPSLAITAEEAIHATFAAVAGPEEVVWYMTRPGPGAGWSAEIIAAAGAVASTSLAVDLSGYAHVALSFAGVDTAGLRHATNESGPWTAELLDDEEVVWSTSIAASPTQTGLLHIAYEGFGVQYAERSQGSWSFDTAVPWGYGVSLALDPDGAVHLAHSSFNFTVDTFVDHVTNRAIVPDGVDQDCDGVDGVDADKDGHAGTATGGLDCDDTSAGVHPGAPDEATDGVDQDCDGADGPG